jgi:hypothetical protein
MKKQIFSIGLILAAGIVILANHEAVAAPDAVSAASLVVTMGTITTTSIMFSYTFKETGGTRKFCYDIAPKTPSTTCVTKTPNSKNGSMTVTNLVAASTYNYTLQAIDPSGKEKTGNAKGTFTTAKSTSTAISHLKMTQEKITGQNGLVINAMGQITQAKPSIKSFGIQNTVR